MKCRNKLYQNSISIIDTAQWVISDGSESLYRRKAGLLIRLLFTNYTISHIARNMRFADIVY